jgi:microcystin-dependent protein
VAAANNPVVSIMHLTAVLQTDASYLNPNSVTTTRLVVPTSGWVRYSVSFGVPPGHLWGRFMLGMNTTGTPSGNYVWFDESYSEAVQATPTAAPVGSITMYGGTTAPAGWLICDGTSLLRTDYPVLFSTIGTAFGSVDSTHFTLPNLQDRFPQGAGTNALATTGGKTASDIVNHTHTTASHQHPVGVVYTVNNTTGGSATRMADVLGASGAGGTSATPNTQGSGALTTGNPLQTSVATGENRPPFLTLNYIIRAT